MSNRCKVKTCRRLAKESGLCLVHEECFKVVREIMNYIHDKYMAKNEN